MKPINVFLFISSLMFAEQPINVNVHNNLNLSQINTATLQQHVTSVLSRAQDFLGNGREECSSLMYSAARFIFSNKKKCCIYSIISAYVSIVTALWVLQAKINKGYWKSWKKDMSIESMFSLKQQDLAHQLLLDIQMHYINPTAPTDTTEPISKFIVDLALEEEYIKKYLDLISLLERLRVLRFIYFKTEKTKYEEYATRISCLKGLFALWLSEYKVSLLHEKTSAASLIAAG